MQLKDYIQSNRHGKDANRLERKALNDPFMQDALDGFDSVAGNHAEIIEELEKKYTNPVAAETRHATSLRRTRMLYWSVAASLLLLIGFGAYFFLERNENNVSVIAMVQPSENESTIAVEDSELLPMQIEEESQAQMEESQQKTTKDARVTQKTAPAPTKTLELDNFSEMSVAECIADVAVDESKSESSAKLVAEEQKVKSISGKVLDETGEPIIGVSMRFASTTAQSDSSQPTFGEKEFQSYCQQRANKNVCNEQGATVKVSFFIDETGKPSKIEYKKYSCEDARKEIENLLAFSPVWTKTNRKVTMTVKW